MITIQKTFLYELEQPIMSKKESKYESKKLVAKINKLHWKTANKRNDLLHNYSTILVKNHDIIVVEGMSHDR